VDRDGRRAPRAARAARRLVGAALAIAGCVMQAVLHNELADPYVLGISGGASAAASPRSRCARPGAGAGGGGRRGRRGAGGARPGARTARSDALLLGGVAVGSILASATGAILVLAPASQLLRSSTSWLFGGSARRRGRR